MILVALILPNIYLTSPHPPLKPMINPSPYMPVQKLNYRKERNKISMYVQVAMYVLWEWLYK